MSKLFDQAEENRIIAAIKAAEANTTGEIRIHIDQKLRRPVLEEAAAVFARLAMHETKARNAVLIMVAPNDRAFAILGDVGIDRVVPPDFWAAERDLIQQHFRRGEFCEGLCQAIAQVGEKLRAHFPGEAGDTNELPDEITYQ